MWRKRCSSMGRGGVLATGVGRTALEGGGVRVGRLAGGRYWQLKEKESNLGGGVRRPIQRGQCWGDAGEEVIYGRYWRETSLIIIKECWEEKVGPEQTEETKITTAGGAVQDGQWAKTRAFVLKKNDKEGARCWGEKKFKKKKGKGKKEGQIFT